MNDIFSLSVTHHTAPIVIRERLAFDRDGQQALLEDISTVVDECMALVTCNRIEIYSTSAKPDAPQRVIELLARHASLDTAELAQYVQRLRGAAAIRHLFNVSAGLDSLIIGEPQILGQVRQAADVARDAGHSGAILERLFNYAVVAGKRARHETSISRGAGSISHAAVELAREILGGLQSRQGLVVGLGEMGQLVARNLASNGLARLCVCNRSSERSTQVAQQLNASDVAWDQLDDALASADICITATGAREPILTRGRLERILPKRDGRQLLIIDIAVPRNVEQATQELPGVHLYDIDSLQSIREANLESREQTVPQVESIIDEEIRAFLEWHHGRESAPVIRSLREHAESIRDQEVRRALRRLGHLDDRDREVVMALSHAITNKMLHEPVTRLKRSPEPAEHARAVIDLFGLNELGPEPTFTDTHNDD